MSLSTDEMDALNRRWSWLDEWVGSQPPFSKDVPVTHQSPYTSVAPAQRPGGGDDAVDRLGCAARWSFPRPRRAPTRGELGLLRRRGGVLAGAAVPGLHGLHGVRQGQVQAHEHAQGALRGLLRALLPVRRPSALAHPFHVAHPLHRQRLHQVHQAARHAAVATGASQGGPDAREVAIMEIAQPP